MWDRRTSQATIKTIISIYLSVSYIFVGYEFGMMLLSQIIIQLMLWWALGAMGVVVVVIQFIMRGGKPRLAQDVVPDV